MKKNNKLLKTFPVVIKLFLLLDIFLIVILVFFNVNPAACEKIYSRNVFPVLTFLMGRFTDIFVFSLTEILIIAFILLFIIRISIAAFKLINKKIKFKKVLINFLKQAFIFMSIVVIWFYFMWGFNYFKLAIKLYNNKEQKITDEYFEKVLNKIISKSNELYIENKYSFNELNVMINSEISQTIKELSGLKIKPAERVKHSLINLLENSNTLGIISPFLLESHISGELFNSELPSIMVHEKSHLFGYANETEANLIAFITCIKSSDRYIQYSGYCEILPYFLSAYRKRHSEKQYKEIYVKLRIEIQEEYKKLRQRYEKHDSALNKFIMDFYDLYLKANNIREGTKAYSRVVDVILTAGLID